LINVLGGIGVIDRYVVFNAHADLGYQLVTKGGFVFNIAMGPRYDILFNKVKFHFILSFGGAF